MGKKDRIALGDVELASKIDRIVEIRPMANEYKLLLGQVRGELQARGLNGWTAPSENCAVFERKTTWAWVIDGLKKCLARKVFELLCPRKPDTKKLNQRLAATPEDKKLAACKVAVSSKVELFVLAKGESAATVTQIGGEEDESEAA